MTNKQRTIWKYELRIDDTFILKMQKGADILCVHTQYGTPCIWAIVDPTAETEERSFAVRGTGHPLGNVDKYIGTFQLQGGALVYHLFEVT